MAEIALCISCVALVFSIMAWSHVRKEDEPRFKVMLRKGWFVGDG